MSGCLIPCSHAQGCRVNKTKTKVPERTPSTLKHPLPTIEHILRKEGKKFSLSQLSLRLQIFITSYSGKTEPCYFTLQISVVREERALPSIWQFLTMNVDTEGKYIEFHL